MIILGKSISDKTAAIISEIEKQLSKPVQYLFTDTSKTSSFGQCDPWPPEAYYVFSKQALFNIAKKNQVNIPFETNILHELIHLCQIERNFPHTGTQTNLITLANTALYHELGSNIASSILDLNVDFHLKQLGYTSEYFYKNRIIRADKIGRKIGELSEIDFVCYACLLMCLNISYAGPEMDNLLKLYKEKVPNLFFCVKEISSEISNIGYQDAESCFRSLVFLFDALNLWRTHQIYYRGAVYNSLEPVRADYQDIHILGNNHHS